MICPNKNSKGKISCIYRILNRKNGKFYIGSTKNYNNRVARHLSDLRTNKHHCLPLQKSFNKYGEKNFIFEIIEEVSKELLIDKELHYIEQMRPAYNLVRVKNGFFVYTHLAKKLHKRRKYPVDPVDRIKYKDKLPALKTMLEAQVPVKDIVTQTGLSQVTILRYRKLFFSNTAYKQEYPVEELNARISTLACNRTTRQIAKLLGVGKSTVSYRMKTYKIIPICYAQ